MQSNTATLFRAVFVLKGSKCAEQAEWGVQCLNFVSGVVKKAEPFSTETPNVIHA